MVLLKNKVGNFKFQLKSKRGCLNKATSFFMVLIFANLQPKLRNRTLFWFDKLTMTASSPTLRSLQPELVEGKKTTKNSNA
jgi:hypothetical protein